MPVVHASSPQPSMSPPPPPPLASTSNGEPGTSMSDPASSLRAAALLTLKSKRRKPTSDPPPSTHSRRPVSDNNTVQLDYGEQQEQERQASTDLPLSEAEVREEGEISDTEGTVPPVSLKPMGPHSPKSTTTVKMDNTPAPSRTVNEHRPPLSDAGMMGDIRHTLDADHVRPGLAMTQRQYDIAKDLVLDLLGWGVAPEYLVDCGLSREMVYYVFKELNLRLPANLDTTGLVPYPLSPRWVAVSDYSGYSDNKTVPSPGLDSRTGPKRRTGSVSPPPPAAAAAAAPVVAPGPSLHDMEQQRRQELLARKAVQASRKPKEGSSSVSVSSATTETQVPQESVEDFLKSIGPVEERMEVDGEEGEGKSRRGTKRPVAADFVDFESGPQGGSGEEKEGMLRRKGSFAGVSGMRRCVIDLSDSEDDGGEKARRAGSGSNGWGSPGTLMEKEEEIRKMRELIAERERNRTKKSSMTNRGESPVLGNSPIRYESIFSKYPYLRGSCPMGDDMICPYLAPGFGECRDLNCRYEHGRLPRSR